jgi:acetyltransferase-like isoleucine patch superfamily enzyme
MPSIISGIGNVYLYERTHLYPNTLILSTRAKFVMKENSGAAEGLTVVTGNHYSEVGRFFMDITDADKPEEYDKDVVIEEDVWISCNVTILAGVTIGRGSVIGAGAVVRKSVPPYALVIGNPSKIVGFKFTPEEIVEHEKILYSEDKRLPFELLSKNYQKFYIERISEIMNYLKQ